MYISYRLPGYYRCEEEEVFKNLVIWDMALNF